VQGISSWVSGIAATVLLLAVVSVIAPKNSAGRVCAMLGNILVILALVSPLGRFDAESLFDVGNEYYEKISESVQEAEAKSEEMKNRLIGERLSAYVLDKAGADAGECKVTVNVVGGRAVSAEIFCVDKTLEARVSQVLEKELGVPCKNMEAEVGENEEK